MGVNKKVSCIKATYLSEHFLSSRDIGFSYKSRVLAGILSKRALIGPYFVTIGDRYQCNHSCIFCEWFSPLVKKKRPQVTSPDCLSFDVYRKLVNELKELGTKVILIGNIEEPFLDKQLMEKIKYTKELNLKCFLITNGSLINQENAEEIVNLKLDYLNVSINAGTPETYPRIHTTETEETFKRIVSMVSLIEKTKENKRTVFPRTRLSMVVCNRNYHEIAKFVKLTQEIGVKNVLIKRFISVTKEIVDELELTPRQEEETKLYFAEALEFARKNNINVDMEWAEWTGAQKNNSEQNMPCYYGWLFSVIDADGNLYPCCFQDRSPSSAIGNIKKDDFRTLWGSKKYQHFRKHSGKIDDRRQNGYLCNQPSCFFNNKQVYDSLHKPCLYLSHQNKG
ncbi:MAG TPA: radical SAM protein [Candidatus Bathyarchaeia archaeon]